MRSLTALLTMLMALGTSSSVAHAQDEGGLIFSGTVGVGILGETEDVAISDPSPTYSLDASINLGGGIEANVLEWLAVGAALQLNIWRHEQQPDWNTNFDIDAVLKPRYAFEGGGHEMEAFVRIPVGFTLGSVQAGPNISSVGPGPGFNVGAFAGFAFWFTESYAGTLEFGWQYHMTAHNFDRPGTATATVDYKFNQLVILVGGMFR